MIDLYYTATPNGLKLRMCLEEIRVPYRIVAVDLSKGEQFAPEFLMISPNNKIPALVDHNPEDDAAPLAMFESGAMLLYLAEKYHRLLPDGRRGRADVLQWLFWQVSGLGPMSGQAEHFNVYAPTAVAYAIERYEEETRRLYCVLNLRLAEREFICDDYSIADIASYPWIVPHRTHGLDLEDFKHIKRWFEAIAARPATVNAYREVEGDKFSNPRGVTDSENGHASGRTGGKAARTRSS